MPTRNPTIPLAVAHDSQWPQEVAARDLGRKHLYHNITAAGTGEHGDRYALAGNLRVAVYLPEDLAEHERVEVLLDGHPRYLHLDPDTPVTVH